MIVGCIALFVLLVLYFQPKIVGAATATPIGKVIMVATAVLGATIKPLIGVMVVAVYVAGSWSHRESFTATPGKESGVPRFRSENCVSLGEKRRGLVGAGGTLVRPDDVNSEFPGVRFAAGVCNPCDSDCHFDLLEIEEGFRARRGVAPPPMLGSWKQQHGVQSVSRPSTVKPLPTISM